MATNTISITVGASFVISERNPYIMKKNILAVLACMFLAPLASQAQNFFKDTNGKWGLKDPAGNVLVAGKYDYKDLLSGGLAKVNIGGTVANEYGDFEGGKWGVVDKVGKEVVSVTYDELKGVFMEGVISVRLGKKWGFVDNSGKEIVAPRYEQVYNFSDGMAPVKSGGKWGFVDKTGAQVVPFRYDAVGYFGEGLCGVGITTDSIRTRWGFIDAAGKEVIPIKFNRVSAFRNGKAKVQLGAKTFHIDKAGNETK